ncbi:MAG: hypothetical protein LBI54_01155 [Lachnospiraceae bacterium]|jgi:hypothetical protein|nr:hypothetical protein [Lachnospiraceae bacterium]
MTAKETYKIWAPPGAKWVDWVRPVPFVAIDKANGAHSTTNYTIPPIYYLSERRDNTALFLDLPRHSAIEEGLALAQLGYRPIPLYNGTYEQDGALALVDCHLENALVWGARELEKLELVLDAPPAFLLDSNRTHRHKMAVSVYDNSWDLYGQDIPSAGYFRENGIERIIVRGAKMQKDLKRIFKGFKKAGLAIGFTNGLEEAK